MTRTRTSATTGLRRGALLAGLLLLLLLALAPAAPAASSGRVGPESRLDPRVPLEPIGKLADDGWVMHGIWDAQATGTLVYTMNDAAPEMTLTATDKTGTPVWSVAAGDVWATSGTLPAAFIAEYTDPDPNVLRSGKLRAYNADGSVRFSKSFTNKFVQPMCDTPRRLVWVEVSAQKVTRVFVRQGSTTRSIALPYRPPRATFPDPAEASTYGGRVAVGVYMSKPSAWRTMIYWLRVSRSGVPSIVAHGITNWPYLALSPDGSHAAVISDRHAPYAMRNLWVDFGKFTGRLLPGDPPTEFAVGPQRIFEQGGYSYSSDAGSWSTTTVSVVDWSMYYMYQRAWVWDNDSGSIWFRYDPGIHYLAGIDDAGALTAINVDTWAIAPVLGTYADAVPLADGRLAVLSPEGALSFIANPVAGL
jgi:hypothetical protein